MTLRRRAASAALFGRLERRPEADAQQSSAPGGIVRLDEAATRLRRLAHDRQAEPGARQLAGILGAVEAVEHEGQVFLLEARAVVAYRQDAVLQRHLHRGARG